MALQKLQFPSGINAFSDANNNDYTPDANGQVTIDDTLIDPTIFLNAGFTLVVDMASSTRPAIQFVGQRYFDTSLGTKGKPVWVGSDKVTWLDATGTPA